MKMHKSLTLDVLMDGADRSTFGLDNVGFCVSCGEEAEGCEPDARRYKCESCGEMKVYGASELLMHVIA